MLATFRRSLNTWPARLLFMVLVFAFAIWGIGDVVRNIGSGDWVARVAGKTIELPQAQEAYQRQLVQVQRMFGSNAEITPAIRRSVAEQALQRLIMQAALNAEAQGLGIAAPDAALRQAIFDMPAFHNATGAFDRSMFEQILRNNGLSEPRFLSLMRADLAQRQLVTPVRANATAPGVLMREVYAFQNEKRSVDVVAFPFAAVPPPADPDEATLQRWYDNHPDEFSAPEMRRIKAIVLSPGSIAKDLTIGEDELKAAYEQRRAQYVTPGKRTAQVLTIGDEDRAKQLAAAWSAGADWTRMQQEASAAGGSAVQLDNASEAEFPAPELGKAVFAAPLDTVAAPVKTALGWSVVKVVAETPGTDRSFDQVREELRAQVLAERANDLMYERANQIDGLLGNGTTLDQLPNDLGVDAVAGSLDAKGNTAAGDPAPIPGSPEIRTAIVAATFAARVGDPPHLTEVNTAQSGGGSAYYALSVEDIVPAHREAFADIRDKVLASWRRDEIRHAQDEASAKLLAAVQGGQLLSDAATAAHATVTRMPAITRAAPAPGMAAEIVEPLFRLKQGEAALVEVADGFLVVQLVEIDTPNPAADPAGFAQLREALTRAIADDYEIVFASAVRDRGKPEINRSQLDSISQAAGE